MPRCPSDPDTNDDDAPPTFAEQLEDANQAMIAEGLRVARRDGRAAGPDMFAPNHSVWQQIPTTNGVRLFVRADKHSGLSNKPLMIIPDSEYGG